MTFPCQHCGQHIAADPEMAGMKIPCPTCGMEITIPAPQTSTASENLDTGVRRATSSSRAGTTTTIFNCPKCSGRLEIDVSKLGARVRCPVCSLVFLAPKSPSPKQRATSRLVRWGIICAALLAILSFGAFWIFQNTPWRDFFSGVQTLLILNLGALVFGVLVLAWQSRRQAAANVVLQKRLIEIIQAEAQACRQQIQPLLAEVESMKRCQAHIQASLARIDDIHAKLDRSEGIPRAKSGLEKPPKSIADAKPPDVTVTSPG